MTIKKIGTRKTDKKVKDFYDNMTIKYKKTARDLMTGQFHSPPCTCLACLWKKYEERPRPRGGRKYDRLTFLMSDLIYDAKLVYLIEKGIAKKVKIGGKEGWGYPFGAKYRAPYKRVAKQILGQIPEYGEYTRAVLKNYIDRFSILEESAKKRYMKPKYLKLIDELALEIQPVKLPSEQEKKDWKQSWEDFRFAQEVANYVHSLPKKRIDRRLLSREPFQGKKKEDFERIHDHLRLNFGIGYKKGGYRNKTVTYYVTKKTRD